MQNLLNNPTSLIIIVQSVLIVMLVAAIIMGNEKAHGSVPQEIADKLFHSVPLDLILSGAKQVDAAVKSDANPSNDFVGDVAVGAANLIARLRGEDKPAGESPALSKTEVADGMGGGNETD